MFIVGLSVLLYPAISEYINSKHSSRVIAEYNDKLSDSSEEELDAVFAKAEDYNKRLNANPSAFFDPSLVSGYTVKKVWVDNDDSYEARPVNVTVDLFKDGELYDTVVLDESSNWQHRWNTLELDSEWRVLERNIPVKYAVLVDYNSKQFLIKNSYAPEMLIEGGSQTATTTTTTAPVTVTSGSTSSTSAATTATTATATVTTASGSSLPQTGQLWWPVLPLAIGGMTLICIGLLSGKKNKNDES